MSGLEFEAMGGDLMAETLENSTESFDNIMSKLEDMTANGTEMSAADAIQFQMEITNQSMYKEVITKIVSKAATGVNDVLKAQ